MKSLPEHAMFNRLEHRLRDYTEQPGDEMWDSIALSLPKIPVPAWTQWSLYTGVGAAVLALLLLTLPVKNNPQPSGQAQTEDAGNRQRAAGGDGSLSLSKHSIKNADTSSRDGAMPDPHIPHRRDVAVVNVVPRKDEQHVTADMSSGVEDGQYAVVSQTNQDEDLQTNNRRIGTMQDSFRVKSPAADSVRMLVVKTDSVSNLNKKSNAQKKESVRRPFTVYASLTPSLSYWNVTPAGNDNRVVNGLTSPGVVAKDRLGIALEGGIQGQLARRLEYYAGLSMYYQNQALSYTQLSNKRVDVQSGNDMSFEITPVKEHQTLSYKMLNAGVHTGLFYTIKATRLQHKIGAGLSYQQGLLQTAGTTEQVYANASSAYASWQLFYRLEYPLTKSLKVFFQPSYSHTFYKNEKLDAPFSIRTSRAGFGVGVVFQLYR